MVGPRLNRIEVAVGLELGSSGETECLRELGSALVVGKPRWARILAITGDDFGTVFGVGRQYAMEANKVESGARD